MSDNTNPDPDDAYPRAPGVRIHSHHIDPNRPNHLPASMRRVLGSSYEGDRNLYDALGYVKDPKFEHFHTRYTRNGTARALVDKPAKDCWGEAPKIRDKARSSGDADKTAFEEQVRDFLDGEYTRKSPLERLESADRMSRLGEYSLLLLGLNDGGVESGQPDDLKNPVEDETLGDLEDVAYIHVYTEKEAPSKDIEYVEDPGDERFGLPESYTIDFGHGRYETHHSRTLHVVEDGVTDDLFSDSVLLRSLNRLDDLEKTLGGSAEAFWRAAYQGLVVSPPESLPSGQDLQKAGSQLHDQIKQYRHNLNREIFTSGDIDTIDTDVANPADHVAVQYSEIAAGHDIPQSILRGNETGERATEEDKAMYHEFLARRQRKHCEHSMLRPLIDYLIELGIIDEPQGDGYEVEWAALDEPSTREEAEIRQINSEALDRLSGGMPDEMGSLGERRKLMGWDPEYGAEVEDEDVDESQEAPPAESAAADGESAQGESGEVLDESDEQVQAGVASLNRLHYGDDRETETEADD